MAAIDCNRRSDAIQEMKEKTICNQSSDMSPDRALDGISQRLDWRLAVQESDFIDTARLRLIQILGSSPHENRSEHKWDWSEPYCEA